MDSFDKKISDLYNADQSSNDLLPEGFGWEDLNEGIYEKMEEPKRKKKFFWMWFSFGGSLFLLAVLLFFFNSETKNIAAISSKTEKTITKKTPIHLDKNAIENNQENTENLQKLNIVSNKTTTKSIQKNSEVISKAIENKTSIPAISSTNIPIKITEISTNTTSTKPIIFSKEETQKTSVSINEKATSISPKAKPSLDNKITTLNEPNLSTNRLDFISIQKILIPTKQGLAPPIVLVPSKVKSPSIDDLEKDQSDSKNKKKFIGISSLQLYGGTLLTSGKYSQSSLRNNHSSWLPGYYAGIELTVLKYKKWNINLGYEHKFAVQLFDFQNITDVIDTVVEDVVTGISTNSLNGTRNEHRETISTQANRTRNYLNYNTFRAHAFRMTLVRSFSLSKNLSFNAGIGGSYNFVNRAKGRTVDRKKDTLNYNPSNSIYRKNNFGIDGGFSLSYQIGKFSLNGNIWLERSLNFSLESDEDIRPVFYKIGLGVSRRF